MHYAGTSQVMACAITLGCVCYCISYRALLCQVTCATVLGCVRYYIAWATLVAGALMGQRPRHQASMLRCVRHQSIRKQKYIVQKFYTQSEEESFHHILSLSTGTIPISQGFFLDKLPLYICVYQTGGGGRSQRQGQCHYICSFQVVRHLKVSFFTAVRPFGCPSRLSE